MMRMTTLVLASLACAIHGRDIESEQMQPLAMHLLMANPAQAHSSAVRRSSMVMQASATSPLQALLRQLASNVLLDNPAFLASAVSRSNMVMETSSLEAAALDDILRDSAGAKTLVREMLLDDKRKKAAQTGPKMKAKHQARAGSDDTAMTFIKDSYPFSEAGYICKKRDEMREYWMNKGRFLPSSLKALIQEQFSEILSEDGTLKEADAAEEEMRKECDEHLKKWAKIDQSKHAEMGETDVNWEDMAPAR
mmetsp:Transcript_99237/g.156438  ORF Transcript_99237/g.156438 Transcript_99237/m.156438 type:complete len:251 (+) Transcript_99237:57-809(+)